LQYEIKRVSCWHLVGDFAVSFPVEVDGDEGGGLTVECDSK